MSRGASQELRERVRKTASDRCGYCLCRQEYVPGVLEIDHIVPKATGGTDEEENLWLACRMCNHAKGVQTHGIDPQSRNRVRIFDPRRQSWSRHFRWSDDGLSVLGRTACGRATVLALRLNNPIAITVRRKWAEVGWHPPTDL